MEQQRTRREIKTTTNYLAHLVHNCFSLLVAIETEQDNFTKAAEFELKRKEIEAAHYSNTPL